jgi:hypothetical protein
VPYTTDGTAMYWSGDSGPLRVPLRARRGRRDLRYPSSMRRVAFWLVGGAAAASACVSFSGAADAPSPADDGGSDGPTATDASDEADGAVADAPPGDAAADGALDGSSPCTDASHAICDDFDHEPAPLPRWQDDSNDGGTLTIMPSLDAPSAPNVLLVTAASSAAGQLAKGWSSVVSGMVCDLDVVVDQPAGEAILASLSLSAGPGYYRVELRASPDNIVEYGSDVDGGVVKPVYTPTVLAAGWHHVSIALAYGNAAQVLVSIDGAPIVTKPAHDLTGAPASNPQPLVFGVGAFAAPPPIWRARFDDVVCDFIP